MTPFIFSDFALAILAAAVANYLSAVVSSRKAVKRSNEDQLKSAFDRLQQNSSEMQSAFRELEREMSRRTAAVQHAERELEKLETQRKVLDLSEEQKAAIRSLVQRKVGPREILSSVDFWLGRVSVSAFFFLLGILSARLMRR